MNDVLVSSLGLENFFFAIVNTAATVSRMDVVRSAHDPSPRLSSAVVRDNIFSTRDDGSTTTEGWPAC
jgi:hypothetical protein